MNHTPLPWYQPMSTAAKALAALADKVLERLAVLPGRNVQKEVAWWVSSKRCGGRRLWGTPRRLPARLWTRRTPSAVRPTSKACAATAHPLWIAVDWIKRDPDQPCEEFDEETLGPLAESLKTHGQLQPIRVRWDAGRGVYVILAGERRWRAARMAGLAELQCVIHDEALEAEERLALQLVENALRDDLLPVEQARAYKRILEAKRWTMTELATELGVHQTSVSRALSLLELPCTVQEQVEQGVLAPSAAAEIAKLPDPDQQHAVAQDAITFGLNPAVKAKRPTPAKSPEPVTIDLGDGMTVTIRWRKATGSDCGPGPQEGATRWSKTAIGTARPLEPARGGAEVPPRSGGSPALAPVRFVFGRVPLQRDHPTRGARPSGPGEPIRVRVLTSPVPRGITA